MKLITRSKKKEIGEIKSVQGIYVKKHVIALKETLYQLLNWLEL